MQQRLINAKNRDVRVYHTPQDDGESARYTNMQTYAGVDEIPIVIDGQELGRIAVAALFPAERSS